MRLKLHKPHVDHLTSKEKGKRKLVVLKCAVTLRALDTFFSTTGNPSESSLLRKMGKQKDCFCLRM